MQVGKVRKKDTVVVIAGKDSGKRGKVLRNVTKKSAALVEGVNFVKRHTKPNPQKNGKGGSAEREAPVHLSHHMVICPECHDTVWIGQRRLEDGSDVRMWHA